jgi:hypothetical protein
VICDRCYQPADIGEHGLYKCPLEARQRTAVVWQDSIEGGIEIAHGLCHADGTPRRFDSRTAIREAARAKGLIPWPDVWTEDRTKDARVHDEWLKSGEAQRARRDRVEARQEKYLRRDREAAQRRAG